MAEKPVQDPGKAVSTILNVAWMAIVLGLAIELLLVGVGIGFGTVKGINPVLADTAQKISWSVIVCVGLALGSTAAKLRSQIMGALGLISAPAAFISARSIHKGLSDMLGAAVPAGGPSPLILGSAKAVEYAILGLVLGAIATRSWGGLKAHLLVGLALGVVFGGGIVAYTVMVSPTPVPLPGIISRGVNEIMFPVGCSLALYAGQAFGARFAAEPQKSPT